MSNRKRRGRGEGSVFERDDGLWVGSISLGYGADGKRDRRTVYGQTKGEALAKLDQLRGEARVGTLPEGGAMTVGQLLDRWLESSKGKTGERTHEERERIVKNHLRPRVGNLKLAKVNALHVEGLASDMRRDGASAWTVQHAAVVFGTALGHAVRLKLIPSNPAMAVAKPKVPAKEMRCLTDRQAKELLDAAKGQNVYPLLVLALATGCRQGELLGLKWDDIDLKAGALTLRRSLSQTKAGFVLKEPKTAASRRTISLPDFALVVLTEHKAAQLKAGLLAAPVFCTRTGNHLGKRNTIRAFQAVVKRAKTIPAGLRFHDLRHTHASLLLSKGQSLRAVSQRLGHSNPAMTLRVYAHCLPSDDAKLAEALGQMMA
jgi:integrase